MARKQISQKQRLFAEMYVVHNDIGKAAELAGYTAFQARQLLGEPRIGDLVFELQHRGGLTPYDNALRLREDNILRRLANVAYASLSDYVDWGPEGVAVKESAKLTRDQAEAVVTLEVEPGRYGSKVRIRLHDKLRALEMLGKYRGLFKEKAAVENNLTIMWHNDEEKNDKKDEEMELIECEEVDTEGVVEYEREEED